MEFIKEPCQRLSNEETNAYLIKYKNGDKNAFETLFKGNLYLISFVIRRYFSSVYAKNGYHSIYVEKEDLEAIGARGLYAAITSYEDGDKFSSFATTVIHHTICRELRSPNRKKNHSMRNQYSLNSFIDENDDLKIERMDTLIDKDVNIMEDYEKKEMIDILYQGINLLVGREFEVITLRYGLYGNEKHTEEKTAALLNVSRQTVRNIEAKVLKKLKDYLIMGDFSEDIIMQKGMVSSIDDEEWIEEIIAKPAYVQLLSDFSMLDYQVLSLYLDGYTQTEIGDLYHCKQASIAARIGKIEKQLEKDGKLSLYHELLEQRKQKVMDRKQAKKKVYVSYT